VTARRTIILIIALAIGLVAAVSLFSYTSSVDSRAYKGADLVEVFVVKKDITKGMYGDDAISTGYVSAPSSPDKIPAKYRPSTALTSLDPIKGKVAITDLPTGVVITDKLVVAPNQVPDGAFSEQIPKGQTAVSVSVDAVHGVGGNLIPGDLVNMLVKLNSGTVEGESAIHYLYQNVKILAIGQSTAPTVGDTEAATNPGSDLITFVVTPDAAQRIVYVASGDQGSIWLTQVPKDNEPRPLGPITKDNIIPPRLTPYPANS
jgi:Flp pilus assembly protein CpaB